VLAVVTLAISGTVGLLIKRPWSFPSLGPAVLLFFESPEQPSSRPLNTIVGHTVSISAGLVCSSARAYPGIRRHRWAAPPGPTSWLACWPWGSRPRCRAFLSCLTSSGASTLIVALGILHTPAQLISMVGAVLLITVAGWPFNRLLLGKQQRLDVTETLSKSTIDDQS